MVKKVTIVGAGPCGVLLAHYLLQRDDRYRVDIYDRLSDPRTSEFSSARTYPISLSDRGMSALSRIAGLAAAVRAISLETTGVVIHHQNGKQRVTSRKKPLMSLDRTSLTIALLHELSTLYDNSRLNLYFNHTCTAVDFATHTISFQTPQTTESTDAQNFSVEYELLVGVDGARSVVRSEFLNTELFEFEQKYVANEYKSIFLPPPDRVSNIQLEADKNHAWRSNDGTSIILAPQLDSGFSGVLLFPRQHGVTKLETPAAVMEFFNKWYPIVGQLMPASEAEAFLTRSTARVLTVRCNRYHHGDRVLIMGDAAHSVSPSLGQGCNAALEDVAIFDKLLDEFADDWAAAIAQFTVRRIADAHALTALSDYALPANPQLFVEFIFRQRLAEVLHRFAPDRFAQPLMGMVFDSSLSYAEILHPYKSWIAKVERQHFRHRF
jgi:kynurenine 3-monooxygenase